MPFCFTGQEVTSLGPGNAQADPSEYAGYIEHWNKSIVNRYSCALVSECLCVRVYSCYLDLKIPVWDRKIESGPDFQILFKNFIFSLRLSPEQYQSLLLRAKTLLQNDKLFNKHNNLPISLEQ